MSNIDIEENWILLANSDFQSRNAKITRFWNGGYKFIFILRLYK